MDPAPDDCKRMTPTVSTRGTRRSMTINMVNGVLEMHRLRAVVAAAIMLTMLAIGALYIGRIAPIFVAADVDNPAVRNVIASDAYRRVTKPIFSQLEAYNTSSTAPAPSLSTYHFDDASQWGLTVVGRLELIELPSRGAPFAASPTRLPAYKYVSTYQVRLAWPDLMVVVLLESLFGAILHLLYRSRPARHRVAFETQVIADHYAALRDGPPAPALGRHSLNDRELLRRLLLGFHPFCLRLSRRSRDRPAFLIGDEYDVQDLLSALLSLNFGDVRAEESLPSHSGRRPRMDFLLPELRTGIEVKFISDNTKVRDLGAELLVQAARYQAHPECNHLVFFVYDPDMRLANPTGLVAALRHDDPQWAVEIIVAPAR